MWFAYSTLQVLAQAWQPVKTSHYKERNNDAWKSVSKDLNIYFTIHHFWEVDSNIEKYWTSMFVTTVFELRLCNSYMWPNQFWKLKGMTVPAPELMNVYSRSILMLLYPDSLYIISTRGRCKSCSGGVSKASRLYWRSVCSWKVTVWLPFIFAAMQMYQREKKMALRMKICLMHKMNKHGVLTWCWR